MFIKKLMDVTGDKIRFCFGAFADSDLDKFAIAERAPEIFFFARIAAGNSGVGGFQDVVGRTVILFELDFLFASPRKLVGEFEDVAGISAAPAVNTLVVVADYTEILAVTGKQPHHFKLHEVGILILIDQQVLVTLLATLAHFRIIAQQTVGVIQ